MSDWLRSHRFWLRPDCVICLSIPEDFTAQDAQELEKWVHSLPTTDGVSHAGPKVSAIGMKVPNPGAHPGPRTQV